MASGRYSYTVSTYYPGCPRLPLLAQLSYLIKKFFAKMDNDRPICRLDSKNTSTAHVDAKYIKINKCLNRSPAEWKKIRSQLFPFIHSLVKLVMSWILLNISHLCHIYSNLIKYNCLGAWFDYLISRVIYATEVNFIFYSVKVNKICATT